jgi:asparagine synthetase B (glutamine-hydrolysing)
VRGRCAALAGTLDLRPELGSAEELLVRMTDLLAHRGADDAGVSILDLSSAGHQLMGTEDSRVWITYNGEI